MNISNLRSKTLELLKDTDLTREIIASESGVGKEWLNKFARNAIPNPGVDFVQAVHDYLVTSKSSKCE